MKVSVYGTGYVGLVTGVCLAAIGHHVICLDTDEDKIADLSEGLSPIYEKGLTELLQQQLSCQSIRFTTNYPQTVSHGDIHIIAVGTPSLENGDADMQFVLAVANSIAEHSDKALLVVNKSTVPVGSGDEVERTIEDKLALLGKTHGVQVVSNPEFLREGLAIDDFLKADRIIVGCESAHSENVMRRLYQPLIDKEIPFIAMSRRSAELSKYAANAMLATKISFINQISQLAEKVDADIEQISHAIGLDHRIGPHYNRAGCGFGGSCFPKDVRALVNIAKKHDVAPTLIEAVSTVNRRQQQWLTQRITHYFGQISGKAIGIWGLAFKPDTDDIREATSLVLIDDLLAMGGQVVVYDPVAMPNVRHRLAGRDNVYFVDNAKKVFEGIDALAIVTEWQEFCRFDLSQLAEKMRDKPIFDGRNIYSLLDVRKHNLNYHSIGRAMVKGADNS